MTSKTRSQELENRLVEYGVNIISLCRKLPNDLAGRHLSGQLLRSGTALPLNYAEARGAESLKDFRHKLSIVVKEARESHVNIKMIKGANLSTGALIDHLLDESNQLTAIFVSTIGVSIISCNGNVTAP